MSPTTERANVMNERDRRLVILGMHAAWMSLPHALRNAGRILDAQELLQAMARHVHDVARQWNVELPAMDELEAVLDQIEKLPAPPGMPAVARRPEHNN